MDRNNSNYYGGGRPRFNRGRLSGRPFHGGGGFHNSRGGRGGFRGNRGRQNRTISDFQLSRFINKAVITEEVKEFIPDHKFSDFALDQRLKNNITKKGYTDPTPIQDRSIAHIIRGSDVVGVANTGTGKTAAFLLPIINKMLLNKSERALIMVPTRELAQQIADELQGFAQGLSIYSAVCVGGIGIGPQISNLRRRPNFVIGTPGRLKDLIARKFLNLSEFKTVVLDEADRMLDMGFIHDMRKILTLLPSPRHTLFFSATLSPEIEKIIGEFLREPVRIMVKTQETAASIEQDIIRVKPGENKIDILANLLKKPEFNKVLIFGRTKHGVERLLKNLQALGFKAESIHGNKGQNKRQKALDLFKKDHVQALVATDVAARGIDVANISHVINYDLPASQEDYVHRIGRTGRAGKKGIALTFVD